MFELDDDETEYTLPLEDTKALMDIFSELEEKNLNLIIQGQENDQQIEFKNFEFRKMKETFEVDYTGLKTNLAAI